MKSRPTRRRPWEDAESDLIQNFVVLDCWRYLLVVSIYLWLHYVRIKLEWKH